MPSTGKDAADGDPNPEKAQEEEEHPARRGKPGIVSNKATIDFAVFERMMEGDGVPSQP